MQHSAKPERLLIHSHLRALVQINGNAHLQQCAIGLRPPGAAGLSITTRVDAKYAPDIFDAGFLPPPKFRCAIQPSHVAQIERRSRLNTVEIRVVADVVPSQRANHVPPPALFHHPRFFTYYFECGPRTQLFELGSDAQCGVIRGRLDIVFRVEPQHHVHRPARGEHRQHGHQHQQDDSDHAVRFYRSVQ